MPPLSGAGTECNRYGITCDAAASRLTAVGLASNNLFGALPDLSGLANLQYFSVVSNKLASSIPALSGLAQLRVFFADNNALTGSIQGSSMTMAFDRVAET